MELNIDGVGHTKSFEVHDHFGELAEADFTLAVLQHQPADSILHDTVIEVTISMRYMGKDRRAFVRRMNDAVEGEWDISLVGGGG